MTTRLPVKKEKGSFSRGWWHSGGHTDIETKKFIFAVMMMEVGGFMYFHSDCRYEICFCVKRLHSNLFVFYV